MASISYSRVVHLSHVVAPEMPRWPGDPPLQIETVAELARDGYALRRFALGEHSATHVNAPAGFHAEGAGVDAYRADALVVPAVVVDARAACERDADYRLSSADLAAWERVHGAVPADAVLLLHSGWAARWPRPDAFLNRDAGGRMHFPGFSPGVTDLLLDERRVAGLGIDTHGVDGGDDAALRVNRRVLERPRLVLENLANLEQLPPTGATLVIGILRLRGGTGSPAGILALLP